MAEPRERAGGLTAEPDVPTSLVEPRAPVGTGRDDGAPPAVAGADLTATEQRLLSDLFAIVEERSAPTMPPAPVRP